MSPPSALSLPTIDVADHMASAHRLLTSGTVYSDAPAHSMGRDQIIVSMLVAFHDFFHDTLALMRSWLCVTSDTTCVVCERNCLIAVTLMRRGHDLRSIDVAC